MIENQFLEHNTVNSLYLSANYEHNEEDIHDHDCYELLFLESGKCEVTLRNNKYLLSPGEVILICPNEQHFFSKKDSDCGNFYVIHFYPQVLSSDLLSCNLPNELKKISERKNRLIQFTEKDSPDIFHSFSAILQAISGTSPIEELFLRAHTLTILARIFEKYNSNPCDMPASSEENSSRKVLEIIQYINHNYTENLRLSVLAEKHYISYSHLSRQFKRITGKNFNEYVNELRLKKALFMLATTNLPIAEISRMMGFCKHSHFTELFFERYQTTPLRFRHTFFPNLPQ